MQIEKEFFAPRGHKMLIAAAAISCALVSVAGLWLWSLGRIPVLFSLSFGLFGILFGIRFRALKAKPVVVVRGPVVGIASWFGNLRDFDLRIQMDMAISSGQIVVKQGRVGAGVSKYAIGEKHFEELVGIIESGT